MWIRHSCHGYQPSSLCSHTTAYPARARTSNLPRRSDRSRQQVHYLRAQVSILLSSPPDMTATPLELVVCLQAGPPDELCLPAIQDASAAQRQGQWLAGHIQLWADEEWTELDVHAELAQRTAEAGLKDLVPSELLRSFNRHANNRPYVITRARHAYESSFAKQIL